MLVSIEEIGVATCDQITNQSFKHSTKLIFRQKKLSYFTCHTIFNASKNHKSYFKVNVRMSSI